MKTYKVLWGVYYKGTYIRKDTLLIGGIDCYCGIVNDKGVILSVNFVENNPGIFKLVDYTKRISDKNISVKFHNNRFTIEVQLPYNISYLSSCETVPNEKDIKDVLSSLFNSKLK